MKIPRDIGGQELARLLSKYDYQITRQKGSHIRLTTRINGEHHITIPNHMPLKIGTVSSILTDISEHLKMDKRALIIELFR
ncbi:MAG TPA: type II toxin-antitoxin system HicA family toxin [Candidatus Omnitrophota bacterium]|nr:type II toxin-antitoxin system HicA family toxin [Candidatus Omnitrophota bacterium]